MGRCGQFAADDSQVRQPPRLQQVDRQRVTLGTTGITSTDVKRWLQAAAPIPPVRNWTA